MTTSPHPLGCARHAWCAGETVTQARDGSPARFHLGVSTAVQAGDDMVSVALVGTEDMGAVTYVELRAVIGSDAKPAETTSVWLTADEACALLATLATTLGQSGEPTLRE